MSVATRPAPPASKGARTAERILDAAEPIFAERGFEGASLREIARSAGIQQPGLYNHFPSKQALYQAVLDRALTPMMEAMGAPLAESGDRAAALAGAMTDILLERPHLAALFQQALRSRASSPGARMMKRWLDRLFGRAMEITRSAAPEGTAPETLAIQIIAMFNLTTGYFLSQRAFAAMARGQLTHPDNVARQKRLLTRVAQAALEA